MDKTKGWIDFAGSDDFIELTDEQWHFVFVSSDERSAIIWIDGDIRESKN